MFDIGAFEPKRSLQRRSSSLLQHSVDHHPSGSLHREHVGLMSFPEGLYTSGLFHEHPEETDQQKANNLSTKAVQLSIFGSTVSSFFIFMDLFGSNLMAEVRPRVFLIWSFTQPY